MGEVLLHGGGRTGVAASTFPAGDWFTARCGRCSVKFEHDGETGSDGPYPAMRFEVAADADTPQSGRGSHQCRSLRSSVVRSRCRQAEARPVGDDLPLRSKMIPGSRRIRLHGPVDDSIQIVPHMLGVTLQVGTCALPPAPDPSRPPPPPRHWRTDCQAGIFLVVFPGGSAASGLGPPC